MGCHQIRKSEKSKLTTTIATLLPRSALGGVELPQSIKLFAGGAFVGTISFKPARYYFIQTSKVLQETAIWKFI